jgi:hypothetical protein
MARAAKMFADNHGGIHRSPEPAVARDLAEALAGPGMPIAWAGRVSIWIIENRKIIEGHFADLDAMKGE